MADLNTVYIKVQVTFLFNSRGRKAVADLRLLALNGDLDLARRRRRPAHLQRGDCVRPCGTRLATYHFPHAPQDRYSKEGSSLVEKRSVGRDSKWAEEKDR